MYQAQLRQTRIQYKQKMEECQQQESLIENLVRQQDALQAQQEALLEQVGSSCYPRCWREDSPSEDNMG